MGMLQQRLYAADGQYVDALVIAAHTHTITVICMAHKPVACTGRCCCLLLHRSTPADGACVPRVLAPAG